MAVTKDVNIGSYIGVPLRFTNGQVVGTLCGLDPEPHKFSAEDIQFLQILARSVAALLERNGGVTSRTGNLNLESLQEAKSNLKTAIEALRNQQTGGNRLNTNSPTVSNQQVVLIVDGTLSGRQPVAENFRRREYQVIESRRTASLETLELEIQKQRPNLVVLVESELEDNEVEILRKFRQKREYFAIPVLFLTRQRINAVRAYTAGATYCMPYAGNLDTFFTNAKKAV